MKVTARSANVEFSSASTESTTLDSLPVHGAGAWYSGTSIPSTRTGSVVQHVILAVDVEVEDLPGDGRYVIAHELQPGQTEARRRVRDHVAGCDLV